MDGLDWLVKWYAAQCDEDWEHSYGIKLDTLDNPGWSLRIDLADTDLSHKTFETVSYMLDSEDGNPDARWYHCKVENDQFIAACGVYDLPTIIGIFKAFADRE